MLYKQSRNWSGLQSYFVSLALYCSGLIYGRIIGLVFKHFNAVWFLNGYDDPKVGLVSNLSKILKGRLWVTCYPYWQCETLYALTFDSRLVILVLQLHLLYYITINITIYQRSSEILLKVVLNTKTLNLTSKKLMKGKEM